jgi:hypothetical protein
LAHRRGADVTSANALAGELGDGGGVAHSQVPSASNCPSYSHH